MIRAFFYSRIAKRIDSWEAFISHFANPNLRSLETDLIEFLRSEFGILLTANVSIGIAPDLQEVAKLTDALVRYKRPGPEQGGRDKARNDASVILAVYQIREKGNEKGSGGLFGYDTWWLSNDRTTHKAVLEVFEDRYQDSCYMRPDFLANHIALAPSVEKSRLILSEMFPTLVGVNISYRVPHEICAEVNSFVKEHQGMNQSRVRAIIRSVADQLRSAPGSLNQRRVRLFLDQERERLGRGDR